MVGSADTQLICLPRVDQVSVDMLFKLTNSQSTLLVESQWYWCIVNHCFAEITTVSSPTGDTKGESIVYAHN